MTGLVFRAGLLAALVLLPWSNLYALQTSKDISVLNKTLITLRYGEGGFRDGRSELNQLGGSQLALDVRPGRHPFMLSLSAESYTNSPEPTHPYEISGMLALNLSYVSRFFNSSKADYFIGGGVGRLKVPKGAALPGAYAKSRLFDVQAGVQLRPYPHVGFYGVYKFLYANKYVDNIKLIDFREHVILLGISYSFLM